jgi:hypothetical protein
MDKTAVPVCLRTSRLDPCRPVKIGKSAFQIASTEKEKSARAASLSGKETPAAVIPGQRQALRFRVRQHNAPIFCFPSSHNTLIALCYLFSLI